MADLRVMDDYVGPGEQNTAETLAKALPDNWVIYAGRKLAGPDRDDVDLIVVGQNLIIVIDEKYWGPSIQIGDQFWTVKGERRKSPSGRAAQISRKLAGLLKQHAKGYAQISGHRVKSAIILSYPGVVTVSESTHEPTERIWPLEIAAQELVDLDAGEQTPLGGARANILAYLDGFPASEKENVIGNYRVLNPVPAAGKEKAYRAVSASGNDVILKCYPVSQLRDWGDPSEYLKREVKALNELAGSDRTWSAGEPFENELTGDWVIPVNPPKGGWTLEADYQSNKTPRTKGVVSNDVASLIVLNAFDALRDVHLHSDGNLAHRAIHPRRVWLVRNRLVKFSDFYLAKLSGQQTVSPWADDDISAAYRAPEAIFDVGLADQSSDVYSLTLSLASWLLGLDVVDLTLPQVLEQLKARYGSQPWLEPFLKGLDPNPKTRPNANDMWDAIDGSLRRPVTTAKSNTIPNEAFEPGATISGRYEILESLGEGGFARTWKVADKQTSDVKVLKEFFNGDKSRLDQEYKSAVELKHENCGRVYEYQMNHKPPYLVSEYVEGESLGTKGVNRTADDIRGIALTVLEALKHIHNKGLVHGDITPWNIIVDPAKDRATLIDFGLSSKAGEQKSGWNPQFVSPEVLNEEIATPTSDIFGFAATMAYAMLGRSVAESYKGGLNLTPPTAEEFESWGEHGAAILEAVMRGVAEDPLDRPASAHEFRELIEGARPITKPPADRTPQINPNVASIRRLYRGATGGNAGNRGLDDQFAKDTYVPTKLDKALIPRILNKEFDLVVLSGNPGDGKTSLLVKIGDALRDLGATVINEDDAGWTLELDDHRYFAIFDASESHGELSSDELVQRALDPIQDGVPGTALLAANDGRLQQFFTDYEGDYQEWAFSLGDQIDGKPYADDGVLLVDLKRRTLAAQPGERGLAEQILDALTAPDLWSICNTCSAQVDCPIFANRNLLAQNHEFGVGELIRISHLRRRRRATFRDVRSACAWLVTGNMDCEDVHRMIGDGQNPRYQEDAAAFDLAFSPNSRDYLISEWVDLDPAAVADPTVDQVWRRTRKTGVAGSLETPDQVARASYFGEPSLEPYHLENERLRVFRYLDEFVALLNGELDDDVRDRLLLGISRIVGAFGWDDDGLAIASGDDKQNWAILHTIPANEFSLVNNFAPSDFIETMADQIRLRHRGGPELRLTLDSAELILRAADGEIINDNASDVVRQEIEGFVNQLRRQPSQQVSLVDAAGDVTKVRVEGTKIVRDVS